MSRRVSVGAIILLTSSIVASGLLRAEEAREMKIIAEAHDSPLEAGIGPVRLSAEGGVVIRDVQELVSLSAQPDAAKDLAMQKKMESELAKVLDVAAIDWSKQMVIAVRGTKGTKLDRIHFDSLKAEGKVLTVAWKVKQRPPHAGPGNPVSVILVDRFDEVKFVESGR